MSERSGGWDDVALVIGSAGSDPSSDTDPPDSVMQAMANLLVRDLPDDVHSALQQRAKREGRSLQQFVTRELTKIAQRPGLEDVLSRIEQRTGGAVGLTQAVEDLAEERSGD